MYEVELEQNRLAEANGEEPPNVRMYLLEGRRDPRRYNRPQHEEVAAVYADDEYGPPGREMIIHPRNAPLQYLRNSSPNNDPMSYPLTHLHGQPAWHEVCIPWQSCLSCLLLFYARQVPLCRKVASAHCSISAGCL